MVDSFNTGPGTSGYDTEPAAKSGLAGFMASTLGKLVVGGVLVLLILAALAAVFLLGSDDVPEGPTGGIVPGSAGTTSSAEATPAIRTEPPLEETFAFRNVFAPTTKPRFVPTSNTGGTTDGTNGGTTDGTTDGTNGGGGALNPADLPANTLFLESIVTVDGVSTATFLWNGETYVVKEGEVLQGTPWKLVSIDGNTVVMLYGDARITFTIGQGITK